MKSFALVIGALQFAGALPQSTTPTPSGCKVISGDTSWPAESVWESALPGIIARGPQENVTAPDYRIIPTTVAEVQAAVNFVSTYNVRVSLLNSGHDFLGRNDAPTGLWIDMSMMAGVNVLESFAPSAVGAKSVDYSGNTPANIIVPVSGQQAAVTFGVGLSTQQLNDAIDPSGLFTIGAAHGAVTPAGGFGQTAGHAPFSSKYGLGTDQILEFKVVTPDGKLRIANDVTNQDLFWALRGGGGGTFGVVVEATVKAFPTPKITVINWWINSTTADNTTFYEAAAYLLSQFPSINAKGVQGYFYIYPTAMKGIFLTADEQSGQAAAEAIWTPILEKLGNYTGMAPAQTMLYEYSTYKEFFDARFGPLCPDDGSMAEPEGIIPLDSHLLGATHLESSQLAAALQSAMPQVPEGELRGHLVGGGAVLNPSNYTSVNPAWRSAYVHLIGTGVGNIGTGSGEFNVNSLRSLAPDMGAYANEANRGEPNWKVSFWGANYPALSAIKSKYDPKGVFWVTPGINADYFNVINGRVCAVIPTLSLTAPTGDNQNYATDIDPNEDSLSNFPGTPPLPTDMCSMDMKRNQDLRRDPTDLYPLPTGFLEEPPLVPGNPTTPGATVTKIRYGPYTVSSMGEINNQIVENMAMPCKGCFIVGLAAGLEYANGTSANIDTGAWLHHMVLYNNGFGKFDLVCNTIPQRIFASGNERTVARINSASKFGLEFDTTDTIGMIVDLMNTSMDSQEYYLTLTYEWLATTSTAAAGYKAVKMAWLDAGGCYSGSEITPKNGSYDLTSPTWTSSISGTMLAADGHVHNGGENVTIWKNGQSACISQHLYGRTPEYISPTMMDGSPGPMVSISDTSQCENFATTTVGDTWFITAHYDTNVHPIDQTASGPMDIMGIAKIYIST